jgi:flavin reductase (DIM6/NTAB) family NADH-FMN oxidoreductase RutF
VSQLDIWESVTGLLAGTSSAETVRSVTARFATGVVVITVGTGDRARGVTVSAFSAVARRPPLVSVALRESSACLAPLKEDGAFAVSALAAEQGKLARHFADPLRKPGLSQLSPDSWLIGPAGSIPVLRGAVGWLDCQIELVIPAGDHELIIAQVRVATPGPGLPLVQCAGALRDDLSPPASPQWAGNSH